MYVGFKLPGQTLAATDVSGPLLRRLFYIRDTQVYGFWWTQGQRSVSFPPSHEDRKHLPDKLRLTAVNDTPIATYGKRSLTLRLGLHRPFSWIFLIANVQKPILGADFLRHFGLL